MLSTNIKRGQDYLLHNTTLGIPAIAQTEGKLEHSDPDSTSHIRS